MCNTRIGLVKMFNTTNEYMEKWKIVINWTKVNYIVISKPLIQVPEMIINSNKLYYYLLSFQVLVLLNKVERVKQMKYLGFIIDETFSTNKHTKSKNKILIKQ
jgi:hypothetical protein